MPLQSVCRMTKFCCTTRYISSSTVLFKQPSRDRLRSKRANPPPFHSLPFYDEAPADSLPSKPVNVVGQWGSTNSKTKKLRFLHGEHLKTIPTLFDKLQELYYLEDNMWFHSIDIPLQHPEMLEFSQFVTRTKLIPWGPESNDTNSILLNYLNYLFSEELESVNSMPVNILDQSVNGFNSRADCRRKKISMIMETVYRAFLSTGTESLVDELSTQIDERATIEMFLKRLVDNEVFECTEKVNEDIYEPVNETIFDSESCIHYRIRSELAWQLRGPFPLKPLFNLNDPICFPEKPIVCNYRPEAFDLQLVECYNFNCLPFARTIDFTEFARPIAGYWSRTPFWEGDPCEFGLLGVLDLNRSECVRNAINYSSLPDNVKSNVLMRHGIAEGIFTAFAWASAQAYNQGFTLYNELTYPICVQLILMDGNHIQLLRFQLNSITSLWKAEDSMLPYNLAWYSPRVELCILQSNSESNTSLSINKEAISLLTSAMLYPVDKITPSEFLRPYLADEAAPRSYLINKSSDKHLIPSSEEDKHHAKYGDLARSELSELEKKALESTAEMNKTKKPLRLFTSKRPHPNDIFFFKVCFLP
ncbi:28S ribosomal mitochondrial isoform 2 [Schistosoma japonicum]|uniref:28S ribosomal mitochondrial isoform 2 n=1 Tax=Schistosoma japonicum TaxID=6182 RepID=A0A4Z2DQG3_SCHJA|nr:28S ribosomal protein S30 mitochondrial [Schistosoma japonicum]TNN18637.1 28S ribosomal mitochondrial isoform 2 [Schistosoma japonicum]